MRAKATRNGIRIKAYAGTTGILLAMNVTSHKRKGLLGFAVEREGPGIKHRWLRGLLRFPGQAGARLTPVDSKIAPLQKFRWSDYSVYPATAYRYRVHGVYGSPQSLRLKLGGEVSVQTESLDNGPHRVIFNRAAAASQAYTRRFDNANPDKPENEAARRWLSRGLREKLLAFLKRAKDDRWAIDMAIYEIELREVIDLLYDARRRGVKIRIVYHSKPKDHQTHVNEEFLKRLPKSVKRARITSSIFHQKFIVLSRLGDDGTRRPVSVLTGTTNFTPNGVYRQANVIHIIEDGPLASEYINLFNLLFEGSNARRTKQYINKENPIVESRQQVVFSPRSGFGDIEEVSSIVKGAKRDLVFCTAFKLHDKIKEALLPGPPKNIIRYGLQNSRGSITGTHRHGHFVTKAFLKTGLEGFLKESTAGQRGNILIHLKTIVCDFTSNHPIIISGSNNFSKAGSSKNDENMVILRNETDACDTYICEMMRLYDHYRFRFNQTSRTGRGPQKRLTLAADDRWTDRYFKPGSHKSLERERFCK